MLQQPIYQILRLDMWIDANAGIAKKAREIDCLCCREMDTISDEKFEGIAKRCFYLNYEENFEAKWCETTLL